MDTKCNKIDIEKILQSVFLIILAVSGNYVAQTLGCSTQQLLNKSMVAKQCVILFLIYFTLAYTNRTDVNPTVNFKYTMIIWLFFLMITKMDLCITVIVIFLLVCIYILMNYISYYTSINENNEYNCTIENLTNIANILTYITIGLIIFGFFSYYIKQKNDHPDFSFNKFIFGILDCSIHLSK
jgi:hypothetical protein